MTLLAKLFEHPIIKGLRVLQFAIALIIFFAAALMPFSGGPGVIPDKVLHLIGNILLINSAWLALVTYLKLRWIAVLAVIISLASELSQSLTASRISDIYDLAANFAGLLLGYLLCLAWQSVLQRCPQGSAPAA